jgi:hypothetical protein
MEPSDRDILERAVASISEQAAKTNDVIDQAIEAGLAGRKPGLKLFRWVVSLRFHRNPGDEAWKSAS